VTKGDNLMNLRKIPSGALAALTVCATLAAPSWAKKEDGGSQGQGQGQGQGTTVQAGNVQIQNFHSVQVSGITVVAKTGSLPNTTDYELHIADDATFTFHPLDPLYQAGKTGTYSLTNVFGFYKLYDPGQPVDTALTNTAEWDATNGFGNKAYGFRDNGKKGVLGTHKGVFTSAVGNFTFLNVSNNAPSALSYNTLFGFHVTTDGGVFGSGGPSTGFIYFQPSVATAANSVAPAANPEPGIVAFALCNGGGLLGLMVRARRRNRGAARASG
jgi:hypothetical protein